MYKDYYEILGVTKEADAKTIKITYKKLAKIYHPDVSKEENCNFKFTEITEAYDVIGNEEKRKQYDNDSYKAYGQEFTNSYKHDHDENTYWSRWYKKFRGIVAKARKLKWWHWVLLSPILLITIIILFIIAVFIFIIGLMWAFGYVIRSIRK